MKTFIQSVLAMLLTGCCFPFLATGQCVYTATQNGTLSDAKPGAFTVTSGGCGATPVSGHLNDIFIINGFLVSLESNFTIGAGSVIRLINHGSLVIADGSDLVVANGGSIQAGDGESLTIEAKGSLTVESGGKLAGGNYTLGDGVNTQRVTNLTIQSNSGSSSLGYDVAMDRLTVNKGTLTVQPNAFMKTGCNLVLVNSSVLVDGRIVIRGNLDLSGGNNTICSNVPGASVSVLGCVFANEGHINQLNRCPGNRPGICAAQRATGCPGPVKNISCNAAIASSGVSCRPLPVELVEFTATATVQRGVLLQWVTAAELNSATFTAERSADGRTFHDVATVRAAGTKQGRTAYAVTDEQPLPGASYYRLRQTDADGTTAYSIVRAVRLGNLGSQSLDVYPAPPEHQWVVSSTLPAEALTDGTATVQVYDALGRAQGAASIPDAVQPGRWLLDLNALAPGVYIVRLATGAGAFSRRIER